MSAHEGGPSGGVDASARPLVGRVAIVTGAARGIGAAVARRLSSGGAAVVAVDVRPEVATLAEGVDAATRTSGADHGGTIVAEVADAASVDAMERVVAGAVERFGGVDLIVANAGVAELSSLGTPASDAVAMFDRMIEGNLRTAYVTVRCALDQLVAAGRADIVLVSTDHVVPRPGATPKTGWMEGYDAAKWGLEGLLRNWSVTLAPHGVRVNAVAMGETDTPMLREFLTDRQVPESTIDRMASGWLTADDIAGVVVALVADPAAERTGTRIGLWPGFPAELPPLSAAATG